MKPDRAFISTAGEATNMGQSLFDSGIKNSHAQTAPAVIELGLGSRQHSGSVQHEFSTQRPTSALIQ
jgi:hypothetical protein